MPRLMMSWLATRVERSASVTGIQPMILGYRRAEQQSEDDGEPRGEDPTEHADGDRARGARVVQRLPDRDDHRREHPDGADRKGGQRHARQDAEDAKNTGCRREADRPHQLADVDVRLWLRE